VRKKLLALRQVVQVDFQKSRAFFMSVPPRRRTNRSADYSMLVLPIGEALRPPTGPLPESSGCAPPLAAGAAELDDAEAEGGIGVIGCTVDTPEPPAVIGGDEESAAEVATGSVWVGPLKLIGCSPATICGVST
jgi:hypothetical protein